MPLDGRVAIVTGAAGPTGRAVTAMLASEGASLALLGRQRAPLASLAGELEIPADRWLAEAADLRDPAAAGRAVDAVRERFGRVDVLVHLVGGWTGGSSVLETPLDAFASMLDQHLWTTLHVARAVIPSMVAGGWGRIMAVSSPVATAPAPRSGAYAVGKAAEETLLQTLAREVAGSGVAVAILQVRTIDAARERVSAPSPKNASWTTPEEIAAAVRYLCSDEAAVLNGACIPLFGGS